MDDGDNKIKIRMAVADTGIGISEANMSKLFIRFSQVDASDTRKYGGSGLGLVITKQIVELMGGNITVQSKEDIGSTFTSRYHSRLSKRQMQQMSSSKRRRSLQYSPSMHTARQGYLLQRMSRSTSRLSVSFSVWQDSHTI